MEFFIHKNDGDISARNFGICPSLHHKHMRFAKHNIATLNGHYYDIIKLFQNTFAILYIGLNFFICEYKFTFYSNIFEYVFFFF